MDLAANEISIYDKLSETVDFVRQTGHQCGMSEKAIEKFIRQLLEKNEPRRTPHQYPLLVALCKVVGILVIIFLVAYFVIPPFNSFPARPVISGFLSWPSLLRHIRLVSLPITRRYILGNNGVPLPGPTDDRASPDDDPWTIIDDEQNETDPGPEPIPEICTGCILKAPVQIVSMASVPKTFERLNPLLIKTKRRLLTEQLQNFLCQYPEVTEGFKEGIFAKWWRCFPRRWFPFTYPWTRALNRSHILHELFPVFTSLPFPKDTSLKNCFFFEGQHIENNKAHKMHDLFTIGSGEAMLHLIPPLQCRGHCTLLATPMGPGDIGYADATYWNMYILVRGVQPLVICDATTVSEQ